MSSPLKFKPLRCYRLPVKISFTLADFLLQNLGSSVFLLHTCVKPYNQAQLGTACRQQMQEQYQKYVNRYGCGMVIYWFGIIDELVGSDKTLAVVSALPKRAEMKTLACLEMPPLADNS